jgi:peptide/nickel transport system permease protein
MVASVGVSTTFCRSRGEAVPVEDGYRGVALNTAARLCSNAGAGQVLVTRTSARGLSPNGCLGGIIKPGLLLVSYVIALFTWPYLARIVRGQVLSLREKEFIESARSLGSTNRRIMFREVLPNVAAPIIVYTTLIIPNNILFEAALSFLGIGVPQETPSWGRQLSDAGSIFTVAWWMMLFPGLFLFFTTLAFNLFGDGLRDALDPRTGG